MTKGRRQKNVLYLPFSYAPEFHIGIANYAIHHNWHLNADMVWTGQIPYGLDADGAITLLTDDPEGERFIEKFQQPVVDMALLRPEVRVSRVAKDNYLIGQSGARHYLELGWRNFAFVSRIDNNVCRLRVAGFRDELRRHDCECRELIPAATQHEMADWKTFRTHLLRTFRSLPKPLAVMAYNDYVAAAVINACISGGLEVPRDVGVLGTDNNQVVCTCSPVALSSVDPESGLVGYKAAEMLDGLMEGRVAPTQPMLIAPRGVVMRQSTKRYVARDARLETAINFIMHNLDRSISLEQVASQAGISRKTLYELFERELDQLPANFVRQRRLNLARTLLMQRQLKPSEIARQCGMTLPTFTRQFTQHFGTSPQAWLAQGEQGLLNPLKC